MPVRVTRPLGEALERLFRVALDESTDAELGGEALGELVLSPHRRLEAIEPVVGDEKHKR